MKKFFTSPFGIIITLIVIVVVAYYIGTSKWFKNMFVTVPVIPADGTKCIDALGNAGFTHAGTCIGPGGTNPDNNPTGKLIGPDILIFRKSGKVFPASFQRNGITYVYSYPYGGIQSGQAIYTRI